MFLILLHFIFIIKGSIIQYDTNTFTEWDYDVYPSFLCQSNTNTQTITFSGTFLNIPKVFITQEKLDLQMNGNVEFRIYSITLTSFKIELKCPSIRLFSYHVLWWAIDNPNIEVINCFNVDNPLQETSYPHSNPEAIFGFISFTSLKITGYVDFKLSISSIDANNVVVSISSLTHILQVGYQIILGTDISFNNFVSKTITNGDTSSPITLENNKLFFLSYVGFNFNKNTDIRLNQYYTQTSTTITYSIQKWCCDYITNYITYIQIPYQYILVNDAFKAVRMSFKSLEIPQYTQANTFYANFLELNTQYTNIGSNTLTISKTQSQLNINVDIICSLNNKVTIKLNYCGQCSKQTPYELTRYCYGTNNVMRMSSRFTSTISFDKKFQIAINSNNLQITQLVQTDKYLIWLNIIEIIIISN